MKKECHICYSSGETKYLSLFVSGSEGLDICLDCEMTLVEYVRHMKRIAARAKLNFLKAHWNRE